MFTADQLLGEEMMSQLSSEDVRQVGSTEPQHESEPEEESVSNAGDVVSLCYVLFVHSYNTK